MSKHFRFLVLALMLVGLMTGSAFAGATRVNHAGLNNPIKVATEALGAAQSLTLIGNAVGAALIGNAGGTNLALVYSSTQALTATNLIRVVFSGAAFNGDTINMCALNAAGGAQNGWTQVGTAGPAVGTANYQFQISGGMNIPAGGFIALTNGACNTTGMNNFPVQIPATASAGTATVTISGLTSGQALLDAGTTASLASLTPNFISGIVAANHTIDYLATSPANGTQLLPGLVTFAGSNTTAGSNAIYFYGGAANFTVNSDFVANGGAANGTGAGLTVSGVVSLTDTANWQGVTKVFIAGANGAYNGTCTDSAAGNLVGTAAAPNGTVTLTIPQAAWNGNVVGLTSGGANFALCVVTNGTSALTTRTISAVPSITVTGTGAQSPSAPTSTTIDVWNVNALQAMIPWVVNASSMPTYCHIANTDTSKTATVILDVLSSENGVSLTNQTLGTLAPKTSNLVTFTADNVSMVGSANVSLSTLGANKRHSDRVTVTINPALGTVSCIQTDPTTGGKRNVLNTPG